MDGKLKFPKDFLWGSATSSHQVEGDNKNNDWWKWESEGKSQEPSGKACDHYNLFKNDFKLAKSLNHNAHRFSLEWSRIEPQEGKFDKEALNHYKEVIKSLRALNIEPVVTLSHFTIPLWFSEKGGWLRKGSERNFAAYTERAVRELGKDVKYWITVNEPVGHLGTSYMDGTWPPGMRSRKEAAKVFISFLKAHSLAYKIIHRIHKENNWTTPKVSISKHHILFLPCKKNSILDIFSARNRDFYFNKLFINSLMSGWCIALGFPITRLPAKRTLDFIGLNYYSRNFVHHKGFWSIALLGEVCDNKHHSEVKKRNFLGWEIYPEGLYRSLIQYLPYKLPIFITENGTCTNDDNVRVDFIEDHLKQVKRAIDDGVPVFGYLHWSLLDNFEWSFGYGPRFGMVDVDRATQRRTVKPSARIYAEIIKNNAV